MTDLFAPPLAVQPDYKIFASPDLPEDPAVLRWRARWNVDGEIVSGIRLEAFPVVKLTPAGAWIDHQAWHWYDGWRMSGQKRWVSNDGGAAWAKPTKEEALRSIAIRYIRWASRIASDVAYFRVVGHVLGELMPDRKEQTVKLLEMVKASL